jgi:AhpD family alkylhydroperoxidase
MEARMSNPALVVPNAMQALMDVANAVREGGLPPKTLELIQLRASQINGCAVCTVIHPANARKLGETDDRLFSVSAWRESPFFTDAERAALALTEGMTRLSDRADPVSDEIWKEAAKHYDSARLGALVLAIANINVWNRINVTTRQIAGAPMR